MITLLISSTSLLVVLSGFEGLKNFGMNLYEIFEESSQIARSFLGPVLIEVMTHRYREHCGPNYDDELNYRDERFLEYWIERDIIRILEDRLFKLKTLSE